MTKPQAPIVESRRLDPAEQESRRAWIAHIQELRFKTPERLEDAAKFLATMVSVSFTLFLGLVDFKALRSEAGYGWVQAAFVAVLLSLVLAFTVVFNFRTRLRITDTLAGYERWHTRLVRRKLTLLVVAVLCFLFALIALSLQAVF